MCGKHWVSDLNCSAQSGRNDSHGDRHLGMGVCFQKTMATGL